MRVIGYAIVGKNEAKKYLRQTLDEFKRLTDDTIILLNNAGKEERSLIRSYGFKIVQDDREWGKWQNILKQDFVSNHVRKLTPDVLVCLDADEIFEPRFTRQELEKLTNDGWAFHFYIVNLWEQGFKPERCFWNVRMWKWTGDCEFLNRPLHPGLAPKWAYYINQYAPFIVRHYGLKEKKDRLEKIARYEKYDPNAKYCSREYYESLKDDTFEPYDEEVVHQRVDAYVKKYKPKIVKKPMPEVKKEFHLIRRISDGFVFDVEKRDLAAHLRPGFEYVGQMENTDKEVEKLFEEPAKPEIVKEEPAKLVKPVKPVKKVRGRPKKTK